MATENIILRVSRPAAEDLSNDKYRFVVLDTGKVRRPDAITDKVFGVLQNAPKADEAAVICPLGGGISKIQLGAALAEGALVGPEFVDPADAGTAIALAATMIGGFPLVEGGAEDELGSVLLIPEHKVIAEDIP